jgi:hypothetical protein
MGRRKKGTERERRERLDFGPDVQCYQWGWPRTPKALALRGRSFDGYFDGY